MMHKPSTIVLAYSGGLDTSAIVPWLREHYGMAVVCTAVDVGQGAGELKGIEEKAIRSGAESCVVEDVRERFVREFIWPTLKAGAIYARTYLLGTSMARPLIAERQVAAARRVGATALAHGCTGKGNDQVRFELTYFAFAPDLKIIAPWRDERWEFKGREDLIRYLKEKGIPTTATAEKPYSRDRNLWHISHEGGVLEDPWHEAPEDMYMLTKDPAKAPAKPAIVTITFERGEPVAVDGKALDPVKLLETLNALAGEHGVGRADIVEDRLVGMKSRGVYETPGGTVLFHAHRELEQLVLDRRTLALADDLGQRYADLVYDGRWWTPEREALDALVNETQKHVTGDVRMKLYRGGLFVQGRRSEHSLYHEGLATFSAGGTYRQADAEGFIKLYGLAVRTANERTRRLDLAAANEREKRLASRPVEKAD